MSIKINFLIISIVILTMFVKMIPASPKINIKVVPGLLLDSEIPPEDLSTFNDKYKEEILKYCEKNPIPTCKTMPDLSYFADLCYDFSTYNFSLQIRPELYIKFLILRKKRQNNEESDVIYSDLQISDFKGIKQEELIERYQISTFCPIPNEIKDKYLLENFRFMYDTSYLETLMKNNDKQLTVDDFNTLLRYVVKNSHLEEEVDEQFHFQFNSATNYLEFIKLYIKELHLSHKQAFPDENISTEYIESIDDEFLNKANCPKIKAATLYVKVNYVLLKQKWAFYGFDINKFFHYLIIDKKVDEDICTDDEISFNDDEGFKTMNMFEAFLHFYKENLDVIYKINTTLDISELNESQQTFYYKRMLRAMKNIYDSYKEMSCKSETVTNFVEQMVNIAEQIQNSKKTKESSTKKQNRLKLYEKNGFYKIKYQLYKCDDHTCDLPDKVNLSDIMDYLLSKAMMTEPDK